MKKKPKQKKKTSGQHAAVAIAIAVTLIGFALYFGGNHGQQTASIVWKTAPLPKDATNDIVGDTLDRLNQLYAFAEHEIPNDENLMRLIRNERASALTREQMDKDLQTLRGMHLDYIGQYHVSIDMGQNPIAEIQAKIVDMVRKNYDVMWAEDFCGGDVVTPENDWLQVVAESMDADLPIAHSFTNETEIKAYFKKASPDCASYQFVANPDLGVVVRGADYRPIKSIQQQFMSYRLPENIRSKPVPYAFKSEQEALVVSTLSEARNLHILHTIALKADRKKKNVLVLGSAHVNHMIYLMARYGIEGKAMFVENAH